MRITMRQAALAFMAGAIGAACTDAARTTEPGTAERARANEYAVPPTYDGQYPIEDAITQLILDPTERAQAIKWYEAIGPGGGCEGAETQAQALAVLALEANALEQAKISGYGREAHAARAAFASSARVIMDGLGSKCPAAVPSGIPSSAFGANGIVRFVDPNAIASARVSSPDERVGLGIPAGAFERPTFVVVQRRQPFPEAESPFQTTLRQLGTAYEVSTYPATRRLLPLAVEFAYDNTGLESFDVAAVKQWLGMIGSTNGGTTTTPTQPEYCGVLTRLTSTLTWGGASFLQVTKPRANRLALPTLAFYSDTGGTSGSGCGQVPPPSDGASGADVASFRRMHAGAVAQTTEPTPGVIGIFGVAQLYDPAIDGKRFLTGAHACAATFTFRNSHPDQDLVAVVDHANQGSGVPGTAWKIPVLVPAGSSVTVDLKPLIPPDGKQIIAALQMKYGTQVLGAVPLRGPDSCTP